MRFSFLTAFLALGSVSAATRGLRNLDEDGGKGGKGGKGSSGSGMMKMGQKGMMSKLAKKGMGKQNPVNCASVDDGDILANNGILHKITRLLIPSEESALDFVTGNPDLTALTAATVRAGLAEALDGPGPLTLFAPNDDAFGAVPSELIDLLLTNDSFIPHLQDLLLYHVLAGAFFAKDLSDGLIAETLNTESVTITLVPVAVNGNEVVDADNSVSNGVVHIIDGVLTPTWVFNSITDRVVADADLSTLLALVGIAGLGDALAGPGELTLLAPTNEAFAKLPAEVVDLLTSPEGKDLLVTILTYHVLAGVYVSSELKDGLELPSLEGRPVTVTITDTVRFNNAAVVAVDILANNGVVHKIDEVLEFPPMSIVEIVSSRDDLTALTAAVVRADLADDLASPGPFTLFAPNNEAFGAVPAELLDLLLTNDEFIPHLTDLLLYHVLFAEVLSTDLVDGLVATALNGEELLVILPPIAINGNLVIEADIDASNGVIHILDGVLTPSWVTNSLTNRVVADGDLSVLLALVVTAGLGDALAGPGELTLLAPTNDAFGKLPAEIVDLLTSPEGKDLLVSILTYHVVAGIFVSTELADGLELVSLEGRAVTVSISEEDGVKFNNAGLVAADVLANNGVLHKIDEVLAFPEPEPNIVEIVVSRDDLTALTTAVVRAGLVDALSGPGPFTLFAPNDEAFGAVPAELVELLLTNDEFIPHLTDLLSYHVLGAEVFAADLFDGLVADALNGESLTVTLPPIAVNGNLVNEADIDASNGVIHIIGGVLVPSWVTNSITDRVVSDSDLSTLLALVGIAELGDALAGAGELTLLAPTNDAFAKLPAEVVDLVTSPDGKDLLVSILTYHVFAGVVVSSELADGLELVSLEGRAVTVSISEEDGVKFNNAGLVAADILANNGVVHKIDEVLAFPEPDVPELTIVEIVVADPELTSLTAAVVRAGLVDALSGPGPFTVFAPTDSAFGAVPAELVELLLTNDEFIPHLTDLLSYHVLGAEVFSTDLADGLVAAALNGEELLVTLPPISINGNAVIQADIDASNGVIHKIDGVLVPSWVTNSITDRVVSDSDLSTLLALVGIAELGDALAGAGELTLLAPTNDAFAKLPAEVVDLVTSPDGKDLLVSILTYHVFAGVVVSSELADGLELVSLEGRAVTVSISEEDGVKFNNAGLVAADILANNGVVHKIDEVLSFPELPDVPDVPAMPEPNVVEIVVADPELTSLTAAVVRAGLVDTLASPGPFTVFAPTDSAFGAVPAELVELLLTNDEFIPHLTDLLLYHVLGAEVFSTDLSDGLVAEAVNGEALTVTLPPIAINGNTVIQADIDASNGVIHKIDGVLTPSWVFNSLVDRVVGDADLSTLLALVGIAGIQIPNPAELTLLAPTNAAFEKLTPGKVEYLTSDDGKDRLVEILAYHVLEGVFTSGELEDGAQLSSILGSSVTVTVGETVMFNQASVVEVDILATNGVLHKIDSVLSPSPSLVEFVVGEPDLSALTGAVVRANVAGILASPGPFTLFAPTDDAFGAVPAPLLELLLTNDEFLPHLENLLFYHVFVGEAFSGDLSDGLEVGAGNGEIVTITLDPVAVNGNAVVDANNDVSNGVVHKIDAVLTPSWVTNSITDRVVADADLSTLLALVGIAGLGDALAGPGELTLLAPTNEAFAKLPAEVVDLVTSPEGKDLLVTVLTYHVVAGVVVAAELADGLELPTLEGRAVTVSISDEAEVQFNNAGVVAVNILTNNGVIHKIDTVLEFPSSVRRSLAVGDQDSLLDFVTGNPDLTALTTAVVRAGLVDALSGPGPFTLFAPNDEAFGAVPTELVEMLSTNDEFLPHLTDLLLYHVLGAEVFSTDLFDGLVAETFNGETVTVTLPPIAVNGNSVIDADNDVSNGVVHIIDGVLVPSWVTNSITDRVVADGDLSALVALVTIAGLGEALAGPGEYTLLAPTNDAFAKLPEETVAFLVSPGGKDALIDILLYHVLDGIVTSSELMDGAEYTSLQGGDVAVTITDTVRFNQAAVVDVDSLANNGVVHKIDDVLIPPVTPTIVEFVANNDELTALTVAVVRAGLVDALNGPGPLTLFAPNDDAFGDVPAEILETLLTNDEFLPHLQDLLLYHVLAGAVLSTDLTDGLIADALNGESLTVTLPPIAVNGNLVVDADTIASNGVVHIIDGVLIPSWVSNSITDRVVGDTDLSTLLALIGLAGIEIPNPGEFTLLAPTNDAFAKLPEETVTFLTSPDGKDDLINILTYHLLLGIYTSGELTDGAELPSAQGSDVTVTITDTVRFNQAAVVEVDILANNGVVHKIDEVLSPPLPSIVEIVATNPDLRSLTAAVVRAGLLEALAGPGPFTLFAPTDEAFAAVPVELLELLFANDAYIPHLQNLLLYHVLSGAVFSGDLFDGLMAEALNGEELAITLPPIAVNGNLVVDADIAASNGVVHIINGVLTPSWVFNSIADRVMMDGDLSVLQTLLTIAEIDLSGPGEFTLLAPTNDAFSLVPKDTVEFLVSPEGKEDLAAVLKYHVLLGIFTTDELVEGLYPTLDGRTVSVTVEPLKFNCFE